MSEIRRNLVTGELVIVAPERAQRPHDLVRPSVRPSLPEYLESCPFCPGNEGFAPPETHRDGDPWTVRAIPNRFSALSPTGDPWARSDGLKTSVAGVGLHEVIVETPRHNASLALLSRAELVSVVRAYHQRFSSFYADPRIEHVALYKNHGVRAGTSLDHPHAQIVGLPLTPVQSRRRAEDAERFLLEHARCLMCQTLEEELRDAARVVHESEHFLAFVPYAALSPFHLWVFPKEHGASFAFSSDRVLSDLASVLGNVLGLVRRALEDPPYNLVVLSSSPKAQGASHLHWYLSIIPRVTTQAGFELGTGMYINPSIPDESAEYLRAFR